MITIKATSLTRKFNELIVVDNLNFQIEEGEIFGLVGPDGAGKSTTIKMKRNTATAWLLFIKAPSSQPGHRVSLKQTS